MKYFYIILFNLLSYALFGQTGPFKNPSFELNSSGTDFADWVLCELSASTPDIQPGQWNVSLSPFDGVNYIGMVTRSGTCTTCNESVSQKLLYPLSKDSCYTFNIMLGFDIGGYFPMSNTTSVLKIWGSNNPLINCGREELLWTSSTPPTNRWTTNEAKLSPRKNYSYITFEAYYPGLTNVGGHILIDHIHDFQAFPKSLNFNIISNNTTICQGDSLTLTTNLSFPQSIYPFKWSTGATTQKIVVSEPGIYWAEIQGPCAKFRDSVEIKQERCLFIPNVFTPNNDGVNETFYIKGIKNGNWQLKIYDRRGMLVYENNTYKNDWKGDDLPAALYYYRLTNEKDKEDYKGWVQIIK